MTPHQHTLCNDVLRAPAGDDNCDDLHIRREGGYVWSFWTPNAEELAALVMGGSVALAVRGETHPPLSINATTPPAQITARTVTPEQATVITDALRGRYSSLVKVAKSMAAMLAKRTTDTPERAALFDRMIDLVTMNVGPGEVVRGVPDDEPTATERDVQRWMHDAYGWKEEAERWRKVAEENQVSESRDQMEADLRGMADEITALKAEVARRLDPAVVREQFAVARGETMQAVRHLDKILALPELSPLTE